MVLILDGYSEQVALAEVEQVFFLFFKDSRCIKMPKSDQINELTPRVRTYFLVTI